MTRSTRRGTAGRITGAAVRSVIADAQRQGYAPSEDTPAVVGIYADPAGVAELGDVVVDGAAVTVLPAASTLAALDQVHHAPRGSWSALVTNRPEEDLGVGVLSALVGGVLRTPDLWETVRTDFAATGLEPALYGVPESMSVALGILQVTPDGGWPVVPGGALTRDHALGAVARAHLGLPQRSLDLAGLLSWSVRPGLTTSIARLRETGTQALADVVLTWISDQAGDPRLAQLVRRLLLDGTPDLLVPLGLVLDVLVPRADRAGTTSAGDVDRLNAVLAVRGVPSRSLTRWADAALDEIERLLGSEDASTASEALLAAEALLDRIGATDAALQSAVLPTGLRHRQRLVAEAVAAATTVPAGYDGTPAELHAAASAGIDAVERAWSWLGSHRLVGVASAHVPAVRHLPVLESAVRLTRWLAAERPEPTGLAALALRQAGESAWVDAAVARAHRGVTDTALSHALDSVLAAVRTVRDAEDRAFALAWAAQTPHDLATDTGYGTAPDAVGLIEHTVRDHVVPLARHAPVLVLLVDGMSTGVATVLIDALLAEAGASWDEALLPGLTRRHAAVAALPTLTEVSRTAFFTGTVQRGGQAQEKAGFAALMDAAGLGATELFHKAELQSAPDARTFSDEVAFALQDVDGHRVVAAVLNSIDDALDKSDPGGTDWTPDAVRHLRDLLDAARMAGRAVLLTSDHGHVVERRAGTLRSTPDATSARSRGPVPPPHEDEVLVTGPRVAGGSAVLPSSERLRYTALKAGYHGGATPAEAVVPVAVLVPDSAKHLLTAGSDSGLRVAPPQHPAWWAGSTHVPVPPPEAVTGPVPPAVHEPTPAAPPATAGAVSPEAGTTPVSAPASAAVEDAGLGAAVVASPVFQDQRETAGAVLLADAAVAAAVSALDAAPGQRLPLAELGAVMGVPRSMAGGAFAQLTMLLNVEGYPVVSTVPGAVRLDRALLREQFELD
ncbi:BREX-2 system phosphatase PglZ [Micrococcus luteus]|uniref:BREX-2 system phosphatase PglZ n=1 Tax=Micrococcus luteus TaxID=1270 RepID=UPI003F81C930